MVFCINEPELKTKLSTLYYIINIDCNHVYQLSTGKSQLQKNVSVTMTKADFKIVGICREYPKRP